jgi:ABC-2 type transport system permease protein
MTGPASIHVDGASTARGPAPEDAVRIGRVSWWQSGRVLMQLSWARTVSPVLLVAMAALVVLPMLFALVFASRGALSGDPVPFLIQRYDQLVCALATPIIALLLGTSAFSAETDDGTLLYLVTTTTPRWWIACVRVIFASLGTALLSAVAVWGAGVIATGPHDPAGVTRAFAVASAFGGAAYAALFTMLSLLTKRALVSGLVYVLFWEGILSSTFPALHYLSVRQWMRAVAGALTDAKSPVLTSGPTLSFSLTAAAVVCVASVVIGGRVLRRPRLSRIGT